MSRWSARVVGPLATGPTPATPCAPSHFQPDHHIGGILPPSARWPGVYLIGYIVDMPSGDVLKHARQAAGLSQAALAAKAGTSRTTLSAYEHGRKSPTLETTARILRAAGFDLTITGRIIFRDNPIGRGRSVAVPDALPRLSVHQAFATVQLPIHLNWSDRDRRFDLRDRQQRARVYEIVLREGTAEDVMAYIDGALLVDLWHDLVIPKEVRAPWDDVIAGPRPDKVAS